MRFENKFIRCIIIMSLILISSVMLGCLDDSDQELTTTSRSTLTGAPHAEQILTQGSYRDFKSASEGKNLVLEALVGVDEWSNPIPVH